MVGAEGTAKTSTALMFFSELDPVKTAVKRSVYEGVWFFSVTVVPRYLCERPFFSVWRNAAFGQHPY